MVAGVCAGLAEEFGISVTIARLAFVLGTLVSGMGVVIYLVLWVVMPYQPEAELLPPYTDDRRGVAPQRGPRLPGGGG